jgi:hypothetical protein
LSESATIFTRTCGLKIRCRRPIDASAKAKTWLGNFKSGWCFFGNVEVTRPERKSWRRMKLDEGSDP